MHFDLAIFHIFIFQQIKVPLFHNFNALSFYLFRSMSFSLFTLLLGDEFTTANY